MGRRLAKKHWNDPQKQQAIMTRNRAWREANPEILRAQRAAWRNANRERHIENARRWAQENREQYNENMTRAAHKRRARLESIGGSYTQEEWIEVLVRFDNLCAKCARPSKLEVDHIIPISKGGSNYIGNIQPLCRSCNAKKWTNIEANI
jgi:5-methylcytosine-specific restriction endonuclease McrA